MQRKFWFGSIGLIVFLCIVFIIGWQFSRQATRPADNLSNNQSESDLPTATSASPLLTQAKPAIKLPQDSEFMVSGGSATATIRFIEGSIKPLDVHVGNTQNFRIVVASPNGIKRVMAEIETDKGIHKVELVKEGVVSIMDTYPNPYTVNPQNNTLKILNQDQLVQARLNEHQRELAQQKTNQANAASGQREVWTGSWLVKDTHDEAYFTNFIAYDSAGNQEKMTMTWTDLCLIPLGGDWDMSSYPSSTCSVISTVDGVDNGDIYITAGKILNLQAAGNFFWNPGNRIYFDFGQLILAANKSSQLKQGYLYAPDADHDRYSISTALNAQTSTDSTTTPAGYRRRSTFIGTNDCNDNNAAVYPGADIYHTTAVAGATGTSTFDYDCSGTLEINPANNTTCDDPITINSGGYNYNSCNGYDVGGCCGALPPGGDCIGPYCNQTRLFDNLLKVNDALAYGEPCCALNPGTVSGCYTNHQCGGYTTGCYRNITGSLSTCGTTRNIAWYDEYSTIAGCGGRSGFYNLTSTAVGCK